MAVSVIPIFLILPSACPQRVSTLVKMNTGKQSKHIFVSKGFVFQALSNITNNKIELCESLRLTSFQKPQFKSVFIVFRIVFPGGDLVFFFFANVPAFHVQIFSLLILTTREHDNLQVKNRNVCKKTTSTSASFLFKGPDTKQATVKQTVLVGNFVCHSPL